MNSAGLTGGLGTVDITVFEPHERSAISSADKFVYITEGTPGDRMFSGVLSSPCLDIMAGHPNHSGGLMTIFLLKSWKVTVMVSQVPGLFLFSAVTRPLARVCPLFSTHRR